MNKRELYKQKCEAQIHEWNARLELLKAQAEKLSAQAKLDANPPIEALRAKLDAAKSRLDEIAGITDDKWDDFVRKIDHAWGELKSAAEGAFDTLKGRPRL